MKLKKREIIKPTNNSEENTMKRAIKIVALVVTFFLMFYIATKLFSGDFFKSNEKPEYQREEILAGQTFTIQKEGEYLVVYYDTTDQDLSSITTAIDTYTSKYTKYNVYRVDLDEGLNQNFYAKDEASSYTTEKLLVKNPSIVRIKDGKVIYKAETKDKVVSYLEGLTE